jgi:uncharacterized repeat protein (TIGR03803 family)
MQSAIPVCPTGPFAILIETAQGDRMKGNTRISLLVRLTLTALCAMIAARPAAAQINDTVLNSFTGGNGSEVIAGLIFDQAGNLYGTTATGGMGKGTVYELTPASGGGWTETVLYKFGSQTKDGASPYGAVAFDTAGNLYGTTLLGGAHGKGTIYRLTPASGGGWTETVLHSFGLGTDGANPVAGPVFDASGNLYGTTYYGGSVNTCPLSGKTITCGTAYELSATGVYSVIHNFSNVNDGYTLVAGLTPDKNGNLFGQTTEGGTYGGGLLFELSPVGDGTWTETAIHPWGRVNEGREDGLICYGTLVFDAQGNLWGTSTLGGTHGTLGTVFKFTQNAHGWAETSVHGFGNAGDGAYPYSGLVVNSAGNLFGTTYKGGTSGAGTVYEIIPLQTGFNYKLLYSFTGKTDGGLVTSPVILDGSGNLYGTTTYGGNPNDCKKAPLAGCGVVFEISGAAR